MTEKQWLKSQDLFEMFNFLVGKISERKLRLWGCACARQVYPLDMNDRCVEIIEHFVDGNANSTELDYWRMISDATKSEMPELLDGAATEEAMQDGWSISDLREQFDRMRSQSCTILRELIGNPFHFVTISPTLLTWNDTTVVRLALTVYEKRILPAGTLDPTLLSILADAVEEAGCTDEQITRHLRSGGEHYRGCWVIDSLLGKE